MQVGAAEPASPGQPTAPQSAPIRRLPAGVRGRPKRPRCGLLAHSRHAGPFTPRQRRGDMADLTAHMVEFAPDAGGQRQQQGYQHREHADANADPATSTEPSVTPARNTTVTRGLDPGRGRAATAARPEPPIQPTSAAVKRHRRSPPTPPAPEPANGWPAGGARQGRAIEPGSAPARSCTRQIEHSGGAADRSHHLSPASRPFGLLSRLGLQRRRPPRGKCRQTLCVVRHGGAATRPSRVRGPA